MKANVKRTCIDSEAKARLEDGSTKSIKSLEIGDKVQTLDDYGKLTSTDVIMIMDVSDQESNLKILVFFVNLKKRN